MPTKPHAPLDDPRYEPKYRPADVAPLRHRWAHRSAEYVQCSGCDEWRRRNDYDWDQHTAVCPATKPAATIDTVSITGEVG